MLSISGEEKTELQKKKSTLFTPLLDFKKRQLPYPICTVPPVTPDDKHEDARLIGGTHA